MNHYCSCRSWDNFTRHGQVICPACANDKNKMTNISNNELTLFTFDGWEVRTGGTPEYPLFVAKDICDVLGIANSRDALKRLDVDEKGVVLTDTLGGLQELAAVNEFGLFALIGTSRKPIAKPMQRWVNHEVLPTIRKTGSYGPAQLPSVLDAAAVLQIGQTMARLELDVSQKSEVIVEQDEQLALMGPMAEFGAELMDTGNFLCMTQVAKPLHISTVALNRFLHEQRVIYKVSGEWVPYSKYDDAGYFEIVKYVQEIPSRGEIQKKVRSQLKVTGKGVEFIHRRWRDAKAA